MLSLLRNQGSAELKSSKSFQEAKTKPSETPRVGFVSGFSELKKAFRLVHDSYVRHSYCTPHPFKMRFSFRNLLPISHTFVVRLKNKLCGTFTILEDSSAGLPFQASFPTEYQKLKERGRSIIEGTMFVCAKEMENKGTGLQLQLMKFAFTWALKNTIDDFCVIVNPKHVDFYIKLLGFELMGNEVTCGHVNGAPGLLLRLNIRALRAKELNMPSYGKRLFAEIDLSEEFEEQGFALSDLERDFLLSLDPCVMKEFLQFQNATLSWAESMCAD